MLTEPRSYSNGDYDTQGIGEFILTHPDIRIPSRGKIYSFNEGNALFFDEPTKKYLESIKCGFLPASRE